MRVDLLGPLRVWGRDGREVAVTGARLRGLMVLLALSAGRPVSTERIAGTLWTGEPPRSNTVQSLMSRLRSALGDREAIEARPDGYVLRAADVDVQRFETLTDEARRCLEPQGDSARGSSAGVWLSPEPQADSESEPAGGARDFRGAAALLREALDLWRGEPDLIATVDDAASTRLVLLRDDARVDLAEAEVALGNAAAVLPALREIAAARPHRQRVHA
ncbi:MAG TPA: BTAD domain-containing putative transcriptional regulator, partial [Stackebrandtia sp.]|uniref:AfsR/SARP family transcriptional regulator n=1 Tax=Stackebrandtia sp. TaxID=2023065 RepID=UPI002D5720E6